MAHFNLDDYVGVHERIEKFYESNENGRINTEITHFDESFIMFKASVYRNTDDAEPSATGHAHGIKDRDYIEKNSHIEKAESKAVGRALAMLGFEVKKGLASREEMESVQSSQQSNGKITDAQSKAIYAICKSKGVKEADYITGDKMELTKAKASEIIEILNAL